MAVWNAGTKVEKEWIILQIWVFFLHIAKKWLQSSCTVAQKSCRLVLRYTHWCFLSFLELYSINHHPLLVLYWKEHILRFMEERVRNDTRVSKWWKKCVIVGWTIPASSRRFMWTGSEKKNWAKSRGIKCRKPHRRGPFWTVGIMFGWCVMLVSVLCWCESASAGNALSGPSIVTLIRPLFN